MPDRWDITQLSPDEDPLALSNNLAKHFIGSHDIEVIRRKEKKKKNTQFFPQNHHLQNMAGLHLLIIGRG